VELFLKLTLAFLGKFFNDPNVPWYYNVLPALLIFAGIVAIIFIILKIKNINKE
jgi:hypothetical protein